MALMRKFVFFNSPITDWRIWPQFVRHGLPHQAWTERTSRLQYPAQVIDLAEMVVQVPIKIYHIKVNRFVA